MLLSCIIIASNSAATIERTLRSLDLADEIIVVLDEKSYDGTLAICRQFQTKIYTNPWLGYGPQKNFGMSKASGDWLLFIDADEVVTPELSAAIKSILVHPASNLYWIRLITVFRGQALNHLYGHNPRLLKRGFGRWNQAHVHEQLLDNFGHPFSIGSSPAGMITAPILNYTSSSLSDYFLKMHRYTTLDAKEMLVTGRLRSGRPFRANFFMPYYLAFRQFFKLLIYRRGFLDGFAGWTWCFLSALYEYEMGQKYLKLIHPNP